MTPMSCELYMSKGFVLVFATGRGPAFRASIEDLG